ncbi:MAG TPA: ABC transporter permease [Acholeplasmataceae bacterium]|jgi:spermidine/putrescine transport system permease protein|nr:ABC transporter permease [Acholeplasmataceae bacterium]
MKRFSRFAWPYFLWMLVFTVVPIILLLIISFLDMRSLNFSTAKFSLAAFSKNFNSVYISAFLKSIELAAIATVLCIIIGYPIAYIVSNLNIANKFSFLLILIMPMFTNMLLRVNTINKLLRPESLLKNLFGISLNISGSETAVILVMVLMYLPFMVFPIFTVLEKIDPSLLEASRDLGANNFKTFLKVTLPLSLKGISSGIIMVFLPCATSFTIPYIVSEGNLKLIGNIIEDKMGLGNVISTDYPGGSLLSIVILIAVMGSLWLISKIDAEGETLL